MTFKEIATHPATGILLGSLTIYWARNEKKWKSARMILGGAIIGIATFRLLQVGRCGGEI